ncbi:MAG: hypothetical protein IKP98_02835 [Bacilli bacterium]|nr:hypothetical protein [Bacilli bacterium]
MAEQLLDVNQILEIANADFIEFQKNLIDQMRETKEQREQTGERKIEVSYDSLSKEEKEQVDLLKNQAESFKDVLEYSTIYLSSCERQLGIVKDIYNFNPLFQQPKEFVALIDILNLPDPGNDGYQVLKDTGRVFGKSYPVSVSKFNDLDRRIDDAKKINLINFNGVGYKRDTKSVVDEIRKILGKEEDFTEFFTINKEFIKYIKEECEAGIEDSEAAIDRFEDMVAKRIINELDASYYETISFQEELRKKCEKVEELARTYNEDPESRENINNLAAALRDLGIISPRIYKFLTHEKKEQTIIESEDNIAISHEENVAIPEKINELEFDYYKNPNIHAVICFLGEPGDDLWEDINNELEFQAKKATLDELTKLFKGYIFDENFYVDLGKNPEKSKADKVVNALLDPPYNFNYRRFGTKHDSYRIHAIHRYSKVLKELKFGDGNIIFFGSAGPVFEDEKGPAYQRVGKRTIDALSPIDKESILEPGFDYIEHITRGYVPYSLLSLQDKKRVLEGKFFSKDGKTGKDRSIGKINYFLFDCLDFVSKQNVADYLNNYFSAQSKYMFSLMDENEKIKNKSV